MVKWNFNKCNWIVIKEIRPPPTRLEINRVLEWNNLGLKLPEVNTLELMEQGAGGTQYKCISFWRRIPLLI